MEIKVKIVSKPDVKTTEHIPLMEMLVNFSSVLDVEAENHFQILGVIADAMVERYSFEIFSLLIANHIRYTYENFDDGVYSDEVLAWAFLYDEISDLPVVINGTEYSEKDFMLKECPPSDIEFFAWYCIEKLVNEDEE